MFLSQYVIKLMKLHIFKNAIIYSMKIEFVNSKLIEKEIEQKL